VTQNFASLPEMVLSDIGKIAHKFWIEIPNHFPFVELGEFVIMPNHVHGIIIINKPDDGRNDGGGCDDGGVGDTGIVEMQNLASLKQPKQNPQQQNKFGPQSKNLASIILGFKSGVKKYATINHIDFVWQPRNHDHIIRNIGSLQRISEYILNKPLNWHQHNL
jgi:putative transposase